VRGDSTHGGTKPASPMRAYSTRAVVTSQGPTTVQMIHESYPNRATTCSDVRECRHSEAVTRVENVHEADNHLLQATFGFPGTGVATGPATLSSIGAMALPSLAVPAAPRAGHESAGRCSERQESSPLAPPLRAWAPAKD